MDFDLIDAENILAQTPDVLRAMLGNLGPEWTHGGSPDDWSPFDVVGHLIHAEMTDWIPRAEVILAQGIDRNFPPFDRYGHVEIVKDKSLDELFDQFDGARYASLEQLKLMDLTPEKLNLVGIHPEFGKVSLSQLLATWVVHDMTHIRQIVTFMAKKYSEPVGPWKEYLSILK